MRGLAHLVALAVERVTEPVEGMHRTIVGRSLRWIGPSARPASRAFDTLLAGTYRGIRLAGSAMGAAVGRGAKIAGAGESSISRSARGSRFQATMNATWGDELEQRGNELRIEMGVRARDGTPIQLTPDGVLAAFPRITPRLVVLVHGLGQTEACWLEKGIHGPPGLADRLDGESLTPVLVRYNTGRHISDNGAGLARLLEQLTMSWPVPIESIALVGNSMGGLVIRSACQVGTDARSRWMGAVDKVVTIASPHLGAPLEKTANLVSWALRIRPETRPLADFLDGRSVGIKDLRFGAIVESDWDDAGIDALLTDKVGSLPALDSVDHHFVAAVVTSDPAHPLGAVLGDLMVRAGSGTGRGRRRRIDATEVRVLGGRKHSGLLHDFEVQNQVLDWMSGRPGLFDVDDAVAFDDSTTAQG
jgi:pimeloyl-ACP methyl ester carboxylesterase